MHLPLKPLKLPFHRLPCLTSSMMNKPTRKIAESLIYEMVDGNPIYYHGYRDVLKGRKDVEAILGSTYLQSLMVANLVAQLVKNLAGEYVILTNELGVLLSKNHWRIADIAIVSREALKKQGNENGYLTVPPQAVIEIDTKAALEDIPEPVSYFHKKTDQLLQFGVEKVIWIFTKSEKVMVAEQGKPWLTFSWTDRIHILNGIELSVEELTQ